MMEPDKSLELLGRLEQIDVDRLVGARQGQPLAQVDPLSRQFLEQPMVRGEREVAMDHQLIANQGIPVGQRKPARQRARAAGENAQQE